MGERRAEAAGPTASLAGTRSAATERSAPRADLLPQQSKHSNLSAQRQCGLSATIMCAL